MAKMRVADQAWVATALLHREHPDRDDFTLDEVLRRAEAEFGHLRPGVRQYVVGHGVAQNEPRPARVRMFTKTARSKRRLFHPDDQCNPKRTGRQHPERSNLDRKYHPLIEWYEREYAVDSHDPKRERGGRNADPKAILEFAGLIPAYDLAEMERAIEEDCERIENEQPNRQGVA